MKQIIGFVLTIGAAYTALYFFGQTPSQWLGILIGSVIAIGGGVLVGLSR